MGDGRVPAFGEDVGDFSARRMRFDTGGGCSYATSMEILFPSELEDKLSRIASEQGRDSAAIVLEAV